MDFDHVGIPVADKRDGMRYLELTKCWLSSPADHPYRVEWLWFEDGSPAPELVRTLPHVAFRVDDLERAMQGQRVIAEPFDVWGEVVVSFVEVGGAPIEFVRAV